MELTFLEIRRDGTSTYAPSVTACPPPEHLPHSPTLYDGRVPILPPLTIREVQQYLSLLAGVHLLLSFLGHPRRRPNPMTSRQMNWRRVALCSPVLLPTDKDL